jgi:3-oxoacyl-[acyl-carrier-protein] synthase-3
MRASSLPGPPVSELALRPAPAAPARGLRTVRITGLGHHVPARVVPNAELAERFGVDDAWLVKRTGIHSRRWADEGETLVAMAVRAGERALADAELDVADVDLVLVATLSQDAVLPNAAPVVAHALGAVNAGAVDVGAACTGWLAGLQLGSGLIEAGRADRVLLIGAERLSPMLDLDDPKVAALFGDGAAATVLSADAAGDGAGVGPIVLAGDGSLGRALYVEHEDRFIRMDGHSTYQVAVKRLCEVTLAACERAGTTLADVDLFVYHQANGRIIRAVGQRLGLDEERVADYVAGMANTSAASIPLTLALLREDGRLRPGQRVLVAAIGAGFTWGAGIVDWELA